MGDGWETRPSVLLALQTLLSDRVIDVSRRQASARVSRQKLRGIVKSVRMDMKYEALGFLKISLCEENIARSTRDNVSLLSKQLAS